MEIIKYLLIFLIILSIALYLFWQKLKKGKPGRIPGSEVEQKTYKEALVVDTRWRKQYDVEHAVNAISIPIKVLREGSKILDPYKDKEIILYCVVDVTSRNTEKILRERGFSNLHIGDGVKQYHYGKAKFKNVLMAEMKYLRAINQQYTLVNTGSSPFEAGEIVVNQDDFYEKLSDINHLMFVYGDNEELSLEISKSLANKGKHIVNLIEPMDLKRYAFTSFDKKDFIEDKNTEPVACGWA